MTNLEIARELAEVSRRLTVIAGAMPRYGGMAADLFTRSLEEAAGDVGQLGAELERLEQSGGGAP
jgi:hypothetical protein